MTAGFSGEPETRWLTESGSDRQMSMLKDFWFRDRKNRQWNAPEKSVVNGASIPEALWTLVGSPYTGDYRRASIVHDIACNETGGDAAKRRAADRMFYEACRAGGCSWAQAVILYVGVRIGAWAGREAQPDAIRLARDARDRQIEQDFREVSEHVLAGDEIDDAEVVEQRTDEAFVARAARLEAVTALGFELE